MRHRAFDGQILRERREEKGLSRQVLGALVGRTGAAVQDWEGGICKPLTDLLPILADVLDCDINDFFSTNAEPTTGPDKRR